jgi:MHS family proline/betaine transporter-like MFS transporter
VGVLPTYAQIGLLAPILLVVLRLFQGFSAGGEWAGAAAFLVEYAPPDRRGLIGSWQQVSVGAGFLLGSAVATLLTSTMSADALAAWGWRIPFLTGLVMTAIGLYLRLALEETPKFRAIQQAGQIADAPIAEAFGKHWRRLLVVIGFTLSGTVAYYVFLAYFPTYVSTVLKLPLRTASSVNTLGLILFLIMVPLLGSLSDRIGRRPLLLAHGAAAAILSYPIFLWMASRSFPAILIGQIVGVFIQALFSGACVAAYVEMFPTRVRYTAISVPYNLTVAAFGGTAPFIATFLVSATKNTLSFTYYLIAAGIISFLTYLLALKETYREALP